MNYTETLDYLYAALPMFSRLGSAAIKKDLHNIRKLCDYLDNPERNFKTIHIGGTNGKGSVSHMLAAALQHSGYATGLYTSPHLYDFRERIRYNGKMVEKEFIVDFVERVRPAIEEIEPSFFEITVAMAFSYFAYKRVDIAVIEVGLGGRLDSTNIIQPVLSVITNIGWDHMNLLGNALPQIAWEKAGIIKGKTPIVIGERHLETTPVFEEVALHHQAPLVFAEDQYTVINHAWTPSGLQIELQQPPKQQETITLDLTGIYQLKNIVTVLTVIDLLRENGFPLPANLVTEALANVKDLTGLQGRWEVLQQHPLVVLDVAHNKEGIQQMLFHVRQVPHQKLHLILGTVKDKDPDLVLSLLPVNATYYFTQAHIPRAMPAEELQKEASLYQLWGENFTDVNSALRSAIFRANDKDLIIICGSIFLVAEVDRSVFPFTNTKEIKNQPNVIPE